MATTVSRFSGHSPTAQLLRNSRLFAIPNPLPKPLLIEHNTYSNINFTSETATLPYPTQQVIQTPNHLRKQGEWGLKRPLPLKTTKSARGVTVNEWDTQDQVTEFAPATHHTKALAKIQELGLTLKRHATLMTGSATEPASAFEENWDYTSKKTVSLKGAKEFLLPKRWKVQGPDLQKIDNAEFETYLDDMVKDKASHFMGQLRFRAANNFIQEIAQKQWGIGNPADWLLYDYLDRNAQNQEFRLQVLEDATSILAHQGTFTDAYSSYIDSKFTEEEYKLALANAKPQSVLEQLPEALTRLQSSWQTYWSWYLQDFRRNAAQTRDHREFLESFLDLPPTQIRGVTGLDSYSDIYGNEESRASGKNGYNQMTVRAAFNPIRQTRTIPFNATALTDEILPSTHPSAGLSYHRTNKVLTNHPTLGPLAVPPAFPARPLYPKTQKNARQLADDGRAYGLAGITVIRDRPVVLDSLTNEDGARGQRPSWVTIDPESAQIQPDGRLRVRTADSNTAELVSTNALGDALNRFWDERERNARAMEKRKEGEKGDRPVYKMSERARGFDSKDFMPSLVD